MPVSRLQFVPPIGVDRLGNAADAAHDPEILRLENMDTDLRPPQAAILATQQAVESDAANSYLPFMGQQSLREAVTRHVQRLSGIEYDWNSHKPTARLQRQQAFDGKLTSRVQRSIKKVLSTTLHSVVG